MLLETNWEWTAWLPTTGTEYRIIHCLPQSYHQQDKVKMTSTGHLNIIPIRCSTLQWSGCSLVSVEIHDAGLGKHLEHHWCRIHPTSTQAAIIQNKAFEQHSSSSSSSTSCTIHPSTFTHSALRVCALEELLGWCLSSGNINDTIRTRRKPENLWLIMVHVDIQDQNIQGNKNKTNNISKLRSSLIEQQRSCVFAQCIHISSNLW